MIYTFDDYGFVVYNEFYDNPGNDFRFLSNNETRSLDCSLMKYNTTYPQGKLTTITDGLTWSATPFNSKGQTVSTTYGVEKSYKINVPVNDNYTVKC